MTMSKAVKTRFDDIDYMEQTTKKIKSRKKYEYCAKCALSADCDNCVWDSVIYNFQTHVVYYRAYKKKLNPNQKFVMC
jgi:hypothetical protein